MRHYRGIEPQPSALPDLSITVIWIKWTFCRSWKQVTRLSNHSGLSETSFLFFLVICTFSALNANPTYLKVRTCTRFLHLKAEGLTYFFALRSLDPKLIGWLGYAQFSWLPLFQFLFAFFNTSHHSYDHITKLSGALTTGLAKNFQNKFPPISFSVAKQKVISES